ncbi:MAG: aminopeptidase N [Candidatus Nanopelagicales bacterium]
MAPTENLTRAECDVRAALISDISYQVDLDLSGAPEPHPSSTFRSITRIDFGCREPGATTWVDLIADRVNAVSLNGHQLDVSDVFDGTRLSLPALADRNELVVDADCNYMRTGEGLHRFIDPVDRETYLYTQFEPADARRVFACFEQPGLKATWQLTVTAPNHWEVVSNSPTPTPTAPEEGLNRFEFEPTPSISTYITAIVAGPYHVVRDEYSGPHGTYPLGIFCRNSMAEHLDAEDIFTLTKQGFAFYEDAFATPYPFAKYDQLFVPEFNAGAMENAGCVTFLEDYIFRSRVTEAAYEQRSNTILHELAHMWFGNLVTMHWWDDLWLNESFAEWASHFANVKATRFTEAWTTFLNQRKAWAYRQDQLPSTHPIAADMVDLDAVRVNFDGITYAKGAAALRQLVAWVGEDEFVEGLRRYFNKHAWGNTRLSDLLTALTESSGRELDSWSAQWLQTSGVNLLKPEVEVDDDGNYVRVILRQEPPSSPAGVAQTLRNHRVALGLYQRQDGRLTRTRQVELDLVGAGVNVEELRGEAGADLLLINDGDLTFAKVRLDDSSIRTAIEGIGEFDDSLARALVWGATWDMTRDAEIGTADYLKLVLAGLPHEGDVGVVQQVIRQLRTAIDVYATDDHRLRYQSELADALLIMTRRADAGSDHQLAFARGFIATASSEEALNLVAGLHGGTEQISGLEIDTEMRWSLLQRLVIMGRAGRAQIATELARDNTATGQRHVAFLEAAIPSPEAKAAAWHAALHDAELPNHLLAATIGGIMVSEQRELLRPHVAEYFDSIPATWADRTPEMAQQIVAGLYPMLLVDPQIAARSQRFLAENAQLAAGARRLVGEGLDGLERAMRCQERDGLGG